jgi:hypothetical protein
LDLQPDTTYAFFFWVRDLVHNVSSAITITNIKTLPVRPLSGLSVLTLTETNVIFQIKPQLSTNYSVGGYYVAAGVTNGFGTGPGPARMGILGLQPDTTYAFFFWVRDLVHNVSSAITTTKIKTRALPKELDKEVAH